MRVVAWLCEASPFYQYASIPHPAPEGRGQSWRYPGKGRTRGVSPDIGPWGIYTRGGYTPVGTSPRGWGRWGGGKKPPPLSLLSICKHPPPRPARRASSPARGAVAVVAIPGGAVSWRANPCAGSLFRFSPYAGPWEASPRGEGQTGRGQKAPSPVSLASMRWHPPPRPASGLLPRPSGRGQSWRYPRKAVSGRVDPRAGSLFRLFPIRWTVGGIRPWGWGPVRGLARTTVFA